MPVPTGLNPGARARSNHRLGLQLALVAVAFVGFGFAMVPIYNAFCRVTGLNGRTNATPYVVPANTQVDTTRSVRVEFLANRMPGVDIDLRPEVFSMDVNPGAIVHVNFIARNRGDRTFVGQAVPSITPAVATPYFQKIQCFCFGQQTFAPHAVRSLPVVFVVKPELDRNLREITLSYTFFEQPKS
ncbi:MAG: cytochrome c oxidase assembly protein [Burkholderiales bacterium]|nr:cytochrome c oxidase assembly protein [Burkholderiales bacterium]MDE2398225.1 cytochrome c oxidase assembly protein [Burkholderiales bacterium]